MNTMSGAHGTSSFTSGSAPAVPHRTTYLWIGVGLGAFVIYGSLVPFVFQGVSVEALSNGLVTMLTSPSGRSLSDVLVNVMLVVPLAFAMCGAFCLDRPGFGSLLWGSVYAVAVCLVVSLVAEVGQIFVVDRTPSLGDVAAQIAGSVLGVVSWWIAGAALTRVLRRALASRGQASLLTSALTLYTAAWFLSQWLPLDLTIRPAELWQKCRQGRLTLWLVAPGPMDVPHLTAWLVDALKALPVGALAALAWTRENRMRAIGAASILGVLAVTAAEVLQVFVYSRSSQSFDAAVSSCGAIIGVLGIHAIGPGLGFECSVPVSAGRAARRASLALVLWMSLLLLYHWSPFDFTADTGMVAARWLVLSFVPFVNYEATSAFVALQDLVTKTLLAFPVGLMLGMLIPGGAWRRAQDAVRPLVTAGGFFLAVEAGQLFLPGRVPDVTDVLTQEVAAAIGVWLAFRQPSSVSSDGYKARAGVSRPGSVADHRRVGRRGGG